MSIEYLQKELLKELETAVNASLAQGWHLHGPVIPVPTFGGHYFIQAIVKVKVGK